MTPPISALTTADYLRGLLGQVLQTSVSGQPAQIAGALDQAAQPLQDLGRNDLSARLQRTSGALKSGDYQRTDWVRSRLYGDLADIHASLERGDPVEEAVKARHSHEQLQSLVGPVSTRSSFMAARSPRVSVGPLPRIEWEKFGTPEHPAPNPPSASITSAGKRLSYFFFYVASHAGYGETETATETFYGISSDLRRRIREGHFAPRAIGKFPSAEAHNIVFKASEIEPKYGQLMAELAVQAFFESQTWSLGLPTRDASWDIGMLYGLRRYLGHLLLTEDGKKTVMADEPLIRVARGLTSLTEVSWHAKDSKTRREAFEPWLTAMNPRNPDPMRRALGNGVLKENNWFPPKAGASPESRLQWMLRYWIAHYHYGAIPARGLPYPPETIFRFALLRRPAEVNPDFGRNLLVMMGDFYTHEEKEALSFDETKARTP